jgi:gamma-glutamylcyclotransferase (GGCT)/AIG2-like uncharacterized protein YtfP
MNTNQHLRLFVYGTLKRGYWNHDRFCSQAVSIEPATTWGRLCHLPAGYPAIEVPPESILAEGTADPIADTSLQNETKIPQSAVQLFGNNRHSAISNHQSNDWDLIHGELMTFTDPEIDLPPIDRLEGFNPCGRSMYQRVLVMAETPTAIEICWIYHGRDCISSSSYRVFDDHWNGM